MDATAVEGAATWAAALLVGDYGDDAVKVGGECAVALAAVVPRLAPRLTAAARRAFDLGPDFERAVTLISLAGRDDVGEVTQWLVEVVGGRSVQRSRWTAEHLLAAVADDPRETDLLRTILLRGAAGDDVLVQLAARPELAREVIDAKVASRLMELREQRDHILSRDDEWPLASALMSAGVVDEGWTVRWFADRVAGSRFLQWQAARALSSALHTLGAGALFAFWASMSRAQDAEVAATAAAIGPMVGEQLDQTEAHLVRSTLEELLEREGVLRPLTAARALLKMGQLQEPATERLRSHASALIRDVVG